MGTQTIAVVNINDPTIKYQSTWLDTIRGHFHDVAAPDTEIVVKSPDPPALRRADETVVPYFMFLNNRNILEQIHEAEEEGVDGIFMACSEDPVLLEAQTLVDVPVAGAAQATFHFAATMGERFGLVIPNDDQLALLYRKMLREYNLEARSVGIFPLDQPFAETFTTGWEDPEAVVPHLEESAEACVDAGADTVVIGSGGLSTMATQANLSSLNGEVPLLDVLSVGFKLLEAKTSLVSELGLPPVSRAHGRELVPEADLARVRELFDLE